MRNVCLVMHSCSVLLSQVKVYSRNLRMPSIKQRAFDMEGKADVVFLYNVHILYIEYGLHSGAYCTLAAYEVSMSD